MVGRASKTTREKAIAENIEKHRELFGHPPLFTLTPEGAKLLKAYIAKNGPEYADAVARGKSPQMAYMMANFFAEEGIGVTNKSGESLAEPLCKLLGPACSWYGYKKKSCDELVIDLVALDGIIESKGQTRY